MISYIKDQLGTVASRGQKLFALDRLLLKQSTVEAINQMYIDFWFEFNSFPDDMSRGMGIGFMSESGSTVSLKHHNTPNNMDYEELSEIANDFGYGNSIRFKVNIKRMIDGFEFYVTDYRDAPIPPEDMQLLMMLGKTKTQVTEAYASTNVFCEFNSPSPDIPF